MDNSQKAGGSMMIKRRPLYERGDTGTASFALVFYSKTPWEEKTLEDVDLETDMVVTVKWQKVLRIDCWLFLLKFKWISKR